MEPFTCACGMKTREPYLVNGALLCVICADRVDPRMVNIRTVQNWQTFQSEARYVPRSGPGFRNKWLNDEA